MINPHILFDNTKQSKKIKNYLDHNNKNVSLFDESLGKNKRPSKIIDLETRKTIRE